MWSVTSIFTRITVAVAAGALLVPCTFAQPEVSQAVVARTGILDEFGQLLQGTSPDAPLFGHPAVSGDLVDIYHATDNVIYPPDVDGTPDSRNVFLMRTRVGHGASPGLGLSGKFGGMVSPRPGGNSRIFARVYNAPTIEEASFYGDSQLHLVKSWKNETFYVALARTDKPLDPNDDDGDGLNNSWEKSYGTDPNKADTDGDGFGDGVETGVTISDPLDAASNLAVVHVEPAAEGAAWLSWDSTEGVVYQVEYTADPLDDEPLFDLVEEVTAGAGDSTSLLVEDALLHQHGYYRVRAKGPAVP